MELYFFAMANIYNYFFVTFFLIAFLNEVDNSYLSKSYLNVLFFNTIFLSFGSAILSALIAVPLAILVTFYRFQDINSLVGV